METPDRPFFAERSVESERNEVDAGSTTTRKSQIKKKFKSDGVGGVEAEKEKQM